MKILHLRFKNLNSLEGCWEIDLGHPAFVADGIFAITGPTGSGKTTILDAICLALYGRTPRLPKVTKSVNEIMSRQTGECFAEVTFATQSGRFRCHWSQHRARKKPDGELQAPKHELVNADSGEILETKILEVAKGVEQATGMDFDRFTRSMLLAQGGFAAFLQAVPDERAPILEQITGTGIYSQISMRVHERLREEREKLGLLQAETAGIIILDPEQEQEIQETFATKQKEEAECSTRFANIGKALAWLANIKALEEEIAKLTEEANRLQSDISGFKADRTTLEQALHAASLDGAYATLAATRKQQADDQEALQAGKEALPHLTASVQKQAELLQIAEQHTLRLKKELQAAIPLWQQVRLLDQHLVEQKKVATEAEEHCKKDAAKIDADKLTRHKEREKHIKAQKALEDVGSYLKEHAQDEWLISGLAGVEEQLHGLLVQQREIVQKKAGKKKATNALAQAITSLEYRQKLCSRRKQELAANEKKLLRAKAELSQLLRDRLLREYRSEKESLLREMAYLAKIAELEAHRAKLADGTPCPLCGATSHPFAEGNVPVADACEQKIDALTKLIRQAEEQEAAIKKLEEAAQFARNDLTDAEKLEATAAHDKKIAEKTFTELCEDLEKFLADFTKRRQAVVEKLLPLRVTEIPAADISSLLDGLRIRLATWQAQVKNRADIEKQIVHISSEIKRLDAVIQTQSSALTEKQERLERIKKELATKADKRKRLYGNKRPDDEEVRLNKGVSGAEGAEKQAREQYQELQQKWHTAKAHVEALNKRIDQREPELEKLAIRFAAACTTVGFIGEEQFLAARRSPEQREQLAAKARELDKRQTELAARQTDRAMRLATEKAQKITDKSLEELTAQHKEHEKLLHELRDSIAALKHRLMANTVAKERLQEKHTAIKAQKKECCSWENLHALIGSADGKKYRNFAQELSFAMLIGHANRQLQKMSDRYLLILDSTQPLELNVIDSYQAGEIRSTKNLSGGESFLVSLALALGLSHMASKKVRVDSLFLDEGFGTLDDEALDTALETLANLRQEGKLIGVISHVPALKERISTQIEVIPQSGGRSRIAGPGCGHS